LKSQAGANAVTIPNVVKSRTKKGVRYRVYNGYDIKEHLKLLKFKYNKELKTWDKITVDTMIMRGLESYFKSHDCVLTEEEEKI
jgi:hypothetical protein